MSDASLPEVFPAREAGQEHIFQVLKTLHSMRATNSMSDITIVCKGGDELKAHRLMLSAGSPYFRESDDFDRKSTVRVAFNCIDIDHMSTVMEFIYTGQIMKEDSIKKDAGELKKLLKAANTLKVTSLSKWCLHRLAQLLDMTNFQEFYMLAEECGNQGFLARIITYVAQNFDQMVKSKQFMQMDSEQLQRVLQHPETVHITMDDIVRAIIQWSGSDVQRKKLLGDMIRPLDLSYLSKGYLSTLLGSNLIKKDRDVLTILVGESTRRTLNAGGKMEKRIQGQQLVCFDKAEQKTRIYDVESNKWLSSQTPPFQIELGMALTGYLHHVYLFGGLGWPPNPTDTIIEYCPATNNASDSAGTLCTPVCRAGAVVCNDFIYIINGLDEEKKRHNMVQCYNPREGTCELVADTNESHFSPYGFNFNHCMYIVGSFRDNEKSVERYDPISNQWTIVTRIPGSIDWCRAALCGSTLFIIRKKEEIYFQLYDLLYNEWDVREYQGKGRSSNVWGMWLAKKGKKSTLFICDVEKVMHTYNFETGQWGIKSKPNKDQWHYQLSCFIWK